MLQPEAIMDPLIMKAEIEEALASIDGPLGDRLEQYLRLHEQLNELRATSGPLPDDLVELERALQEVLEQAKAERER
jgi:hypothetical protein